VAHPASIVVLVAALASAASAQVDALASASRSDAITRYGAQFEPLVEEYLRDDQGELPPGENRWPDFVAAISEFRAVRERVDPEYPNDSSALKQAGELEAWSDAVASRAQTLVKELSDSGIFARVRPIVSERRFIQPAQAGYVLNWLMPPLGDARALMRAETIRMRLAAAAGDDATAIESFGHVLAIARILAHQPIMLERFVAIAGVDRVLAELRYQLRERQWSERTLRSFLACMDAELPFPSPKLLFEAERLTVLDGLREVYENPDRTPLEQIRLLVQSGSKEETDDRMRTLSGYGIATKEEAERFVEEIHQRYIRALGLPPMEFIAEVSAINEAGHDAPARMIVPRALMNGHTKASLAIVQSDVGIGGTRVMLALELYRGLHGEYPDSLNQLVPACIPKLPLDPYPQASFVYRRLPKAEDPDSLGYSLYSLGYDLKDDGGRVHPKTPAAATTPSGPGYDFVLNSRRAAATTER
jgi:hypothetical protein